MRNKYLVLGIAVALGSCNSALNKEETTGAESQPQTQVVEISGQEAVNDEESNPNILQVALGSKDHTTLVAAVQAAEQTTALANNGPLTVFAPPNRAFDALPEGTLESLLKPENKSQLVSIIQFHAAPGKYDVDQLKDGQSLFVASGHNIKIEKRDGDTYVHGAKIIGTVSASNGIVHIVDKVLLPG